MLYLTCTAITSVDRAHYGVSRAKDWVSVDCGTNAPFINLYVLYVNKIFGKIYALTSSPFINLYYCMQTIS